MSRYDELKEGLQQTQYTWLVTGVAGFIGSNLLETLLTLNQRVVGLDNFATGYQKNIDMALEVVSEESRHELFTFVEGDITDVDVCRSSCDGVDFVLQQAALV